MTPFLACESYDLLSFLSGLAANAKLEPERPPAAAKSHGSTATATPA